MNERKPLKNDNKIESSAAGLRKRKAYTRPVIRLFGPVGQLTQSGTGVQMEDINPQLMCTGGGNRSMC